MIRIISVSVFLVSFLLVSNAQQLPKNWHVDEDNHRLKMELKNEADFYDINSLESVNLDFYDSNYWSLMHLYYDTENYVAAKLTYKGVVYDSVGVQFKGQTSYRKAKQQGSSKFSFDVKTDQYIDGQEIDGYSTFNFNNAFMDDSFVREVLYTNLASRHIPAARSNYIQLFLNNEYWGLYPNIQQVNNDLVGEWFQDNNGIRWRADAPKNAPPDPNTPPGPNWGDGTAALNYHSDDTTDYQSYYTLKSSEVDNPWDYLVDACRVLNGEANTEYLDSLNSKFDIDAILWYLATEILFSDDDSYVYKGKMDYSLYYDQNTGRITPLEIDGNSVMAGKNSSWGLFYHENDQNYPLLNKLLKIPEIRQRYIAHVKTILEESFNEESKDMIDEYKSNIVDLVKDDPKTSTTLPKFNNSINGLKIFIDSRREFIESNQEMNGLSPIIEDVFFITEGEKWKNPKKGQSVEIHARASHPDEIQTVNLYYSNALFGSFTKFPMQANEDDFSISLDNFEEGNFVRFYIEAIASDDQYSRSYFPVGAEHDVMFFEIEAEYLENSYVVINEFMASNASVVTDQDGEYDDWIEFYNLSENDIDLSGYFLSDKPDNQTKWEFPQGTEIEANGYLIVWADENGSEEGLHANFKLSKSGENILLSTPGLLIADEVEFGEQQTDLSYARFPNGTGDFVIQEATYAHNNDDVNDIQQLVQSENLKIYPNPASNFVKLELENSSSTKDKISIFDALGSEIYTGQIQNDQSIDLSNWEAGVYFVKSGNYFAKLILQ